MIAKVTHVYPHNGMALGTVTEHDLQSPWEFNLPECDVCRGPDKCVQTTIVSKNFQDADALVIHGLTSCPIVEVKLPFPAENPMQAADLDKIVPRMEAEEVRAAFMKGFNGGDH